MSPIVASVLSPSPLITPLLIAVGAVLGALSRYYVTIQFGQWFGVTFPFGTFFINLTGAFVMGAVMALPLDQWAIGQPLRLLLAVGFLGSYTTFSTYGLDTIMLLRTRNYGRSIFYWAGSIILGLVCVTLGHELGEKLG